MTIETLKVLLLGNGAREAALLCRLLRSDLLGELHLAPPHALVPPRYKGVVLNVSSLKVDNVHEVVKYCQNHSIDLVIPGSETFLALGIQDALRKVGVYCFGPSKAAAQIESSKEFSKNFMKKYHIPTANYKIFYDAPSAKSYIKSNPVPIVIKASGLAFGKGVVIATTHDEALATVEEIMVKKIFGDAGSSLIVETFLIGEEISYLVFTDGYTIVPMPPAQDYKRALDHDQGPNTGGMGSIAPVTWVNESLKKDILEKVMKPTLAGLRKEGFPFCGVLYAGLMIDRSSAGRSSISVLEFNARFGDPETQSLMHLLDPECDLLNIMMACVQGRLDSIKVNFVKKSAATVVCASAGYPGKFDKNLVMDCRLDETSYSYNEDALHVYFGGALRDPNGNFFTNGGRVLSITCASDTLEKALSTIYANLNGRHPIVRFPGMHFRKDIGKLGINAEDQQSTDDITYAKAGVSIDDGNKFVDAIKRLTRLTRRTGADAEIGGFGGLFDLSSVIQKMDMPILVSSADGVGTKLLLAKMLGNFSTVGIDLVAMNVNDLLVQGAEPIFFLDYYASSKLLVDEATQVIEGIVDGCLESGSALIGGETAEMPGLYSPGDFDLAGFAVGIVEKERLLPNLTSIKESDIIIGLSSSGFHSNGYSLIRYILNLKNIDLTSPESQAIWGPPLLEPTRIYVPYILPILKSYPTLIKAMAHITGGGFVDNIPRVIPSQLQAVIDWNTWIKPPIFKKIQEMGNIKNEEIIRTWNCGIGLVIVVDKESADPIIELLHDVSETLKLSNRRANSGEMKAWKIGFLRSKSTASDESVVVNNIGSI